MSDSTDLATREIFKIMARNPRIHELTRIVDMSPLIARVDQNVSAGQISSAAEQLTFKAAKRKLSWFSKTKNICVYLSACQPKSIKELEEISKSYLQLV